MSLRLNTDQNPITVPTASPSAEGLMSADDKTKLDGLTPGGAVFVNAPLTGDGSALSPIDASEFLARTGGTMSGALFVPAIEGVAGNLTIGANTVNGLIGTTTGAQIGWNAFQIYMYTPGGMQLVLDDNVPAFAFTGAPISVDTINAPAGTFLALDAPGNILFLGTTGAAVLGQNSTEISFYGGTPIVKPTGVLVTAAGIHAALVALNLIAA